MELLSAHFTSVFFCHPMTSLMATQGTGFCVSFSTDVALKLPQHPKFGQFSRRRHLQNRNDQSSINSEQTSGV
jgi:hypothetical protein